MAKLAFAVIRMPRHMMCVLVMVLVPTATLIVLMLFVLVVMMLVTAATLIVIMLIVLMMMLVTAAAFIVIMLFMLMMMLLVSSVVITTAAVIMLFRSMLMRMAAAITMAVLWDMPHAGMIMVLATVTTGAAFGMGTIIFIPLNMAVHMSKATHLLGGVTHFF